MIATVVGTTSDPASDGSAKARAQIAKELGEIRDAVKANQALNARVAPLESEVRRLQAASGR